MPCPSPVNAPSSAAKTSCPRSASACTSRPRRNSAATSPPTRCGASTTPASPPTASAPRCPNAGTGTYQLDVRIDTTARKGHRLQRSGYATQTAAEKALGRIGDLLGLRGCRRPDAPPIGDLIVAKSKHKGELPTSDDVRRKLGAGTDPNAPETTVAEWLEEWYAGKRGKKLSTRTLYRGHLDHYLIPLLGDIPRDKLRVEHVSGIFGTIEEWNAEIIAAKKEGRKPYLPDDKRKVHRVVGIASQHRNLATLRNAYNVAVKRPGMLDWNPVPGGRAAAGDARPGARLVA